MASRLVEVLLAGLGFAYVFASDGSARQEGRYLALFDLLAVSYLVGGLIAVRRHRFDPDEPVEPPRRWLAAVYGRRFTFFFTFIASLTGLAAAIDVVAFRDSTELASVIRGLGVVGVIAAWLLLQTGYARFYEHLYRTGGGGLRFPATAHPHMIEFMYFAVTLGVSFAVSDVEVIRRDIRWHVMVHSVLSFLYNAAVLAVAISAVAAN